MNPISTPYDAPIGTNGNSPVAALVIPGADIFDALWVFNTGSVAGGISIDGGTTYLPMPANESFELEDLFLQNVTIYIQRITGGSDLSGVSLIAVKKRW
jgi:hypothetical protein